MVGIIAGIILLLLGVVIIRFTFKKLKPAEKMLGAANVKKLSELITGLIIISVMMSVGVCAIVYSLLQWPK